MQICDIILEKDDMAPEDFGELAVILKITGCEYLGMRWCKLSQRKLSFLGEMCRVENVKVHRNSTKIHLSNFRNHLTLTRTEFLF